MLKNNRVIVDLNKVQWARFGYRNQYGDWKNTQPALPTHRGITIDIQAVHIVDKRPMLQWAEDHRMVDIWEPELYLKLQANERLCYTGNKAKSIWQEWNKRIFKKESI